MSETQTIPLTDDGGLSSKLLFPTKPLLLIPELAVLIGLPEALLLQQIHYWLFIFKDKPQAREWVYNTFEEWQLQFPFFSKKTLQRTMKSLVRRKLVLVSRFNEKYGDRTNHYAIDYAVVAKLNQQIQNIAEEREQKRIQFGKKRRGRFGHSVPFMETH